MITLVILLPYAFWSAWAELKIFASFRGRNAMSINLVLLRAR